MEALATRLGSMKKKPGAAGDSPLRAGGGGGGSMVMSTSSGGFTTTEDVERACRNIDALMADLRQMSVKIKGTEQFATTKSTFVDWALELQGLATKVDDVMFEFRYAGQDEQLEKLRSMQKAQNSRKFNIANLVSQMKERAQSETPDESPPEPSGAGTPRQQGKSGLPPRLPPRHATMSDSGDSPVQSRPGTQQSPRGASRGGAGGAGLPAPHSELPTIATNPKHVQTELMASTLHVMLDSALRSVDATTATLFVPVNGDMEHLEAVCDVGRGPDTVLSRLAVKDAASAPCLAASSGIMITICRGHDPAAEKPQSTTELYNAASTTFRESVRMALTPHASKASATDDLDVNALAVAAADTSMSPRHAIQTPSSKGPTRRTTVWSAVSVPIRQHSNSRAVAVLHVVNKSGGRANFEPEDEHVLFGVGTMLSHYFTRVPDPRALARHYQPTRPMPPVSQPPRVKLHHRGTSVPEPNYGIRHQLVWRTWDHPGTVRDVKVLINDQAIKLDERVPVMRVYDYIEQLQTSWRQSALLNIEYQQAFDQRTAYLTTLVHKLKSAALKNEALQAMVRELRGARNAPPLPPGLPASPPRPGTDATPATTAKHKKGRKKRQPQRVAAGGGSPSHEESADDDLSDSDTDSIDRAQAERPYFLPPRGQLAGLESDPTPGAQSISGGLGDASASQHNLAILSSSESEDDIIRAVEADGAEVRRPPLPAAAAGGKGWSSGDDDDDIRASSRSTVALDEDDPKGPLDGDGVGAPAAGGRPPAMDIAAVSSSPGMSGRQQ